MRTSAYPWAGSVTGKQRAEQVTRMRYVGCYITAFETAPKNEKRMSFASLVSFHINQLAQV